MSPRRNPVRFLGGIAIWAALAGGVTTLALARSHELGPPAEKVARYAFHSPGRIEVPIAAIDDGYGWCSVDSRDPVLLGDEQRTFIGTVLSVRPDTASVGTPSFIATIALDPEYDPADFEGARFDFGVSRGDPAWILDTLLPPKKRDVVIDELRRYASEHSKEIHELLEPIEEQVIAHAEKVLEANFAATMNRHEPEINALLDKYRGSLKDELLPVLKEELGPSAKEKAKPILTKIGRECWDALPMWEGVWSWTKTKLPWQKTDYVDKWWQEFLETKAIPILKDHEPELVKAGEDLVKEGFKDPKVRAAFLGVMKKLANDPDFKKLARTIVEEALIKPFDPVALWKKIAAEPKNKVHFRKLQESFAPVTQRIVRLVAVQIRPDKREGLSPEVARVLRRVVLNKDSRWVMVTPRHAVVGPLRGARPPAADTPPPPGTRR